MSDHRKLAHLEEQLGDVLYRAIIDPENTAAVKTFARTLILAVKPVGLPTTYDQALGLTELIRRAVGPDNLGNINSDITQARFPLQGTGVRKVKARVVPYLDGETSEEIAVRLAGCAFGNTGDLAGFLHDHPEEVEKWGWVLAISEDSRWAGPDGGDVCVPVVRVCGAYRGFGLVGFRRRLRSDFVSNCGVLVLCE
ncbi:MAG: hypothetical protein AAB673_02190 [Patescibacteria group bacterium]